MKKIFIQTVTDMKQTDIMISGPADPQTAHELFEYMFSNTENPQIMKINNAEFFVSYNFETDQQTVCYLISDYDPKMRYAVVDVSGIYLLKTRKDATALFYRKTETMDGLTARSGKYFVSDRGELTAVIDLQRISSRIIRFSK